MSDDDFDRAARSMVLWDTMSAVAELYALKPDQDLKLAWDLLFQVYTGEFGFEAPAGVLNTTWNSMMKEFENEAVPTRVSEAHRLGGDCCSGCGHHRSREEKLAHKTLCKNCIELFTEEAKHLFRDRWYR